MERVQAKSELKKEFLTQCQLKKEDAEKIVKSDLARMMAEYLIDNGLIEFSETQHFDSFVYFGEFFLIKSGEFHEAKKRLKRAIFLCPQELSDDLIRLSRILFGKEV